MAIDSPVYQAISMVRELFCLENKVELYSYKTEDDFYDCWDNLDIDEETSESGIDTPVVWDHGTAIIVWDGVPRTGSGPVNTERYLTPIDWAVGYSLTHDRTYCKKVDFRTLRLVIVGAGVEGDSYLEEGLLHLLQSMPWIHYYRPSMVASGVDGQSFICNLIHNIYATKEETFRGRKPDIDFMKNCWAARLTRPSVPGDHHALANLVGPLLLMKGAAKEDVHVMALQRLMRAVGLLPEDQKEDSLLSRATPWIDWDKESWGGRLERLTKNNQPLNLVLVDDMYKSGWGEVLCRAVGANHKAGQAESESGVVGVERQELSRVRVEKAIERRTHSKVERVVVRAFSSADLILERLGKITLADKDQRFRFSVTGAEGENLSEILFLDLRLFAEKGIEEEVKFFKRLLDIAKKRFESERSPDLPWHGFTKDELQRVDKWIADKDREREQDGYMVALTLLPRVLALTDMSLPIVIFSSTGRRDIAEMLKPYGNIITDFDKPKFTVDIPIDIADQIKSKFNEAMRKALDLCHARLFINMIRSVAPIKCSEEIKECDHFEVYIDETGSTEQRHFAVGGLLVGYENERDARSVHDKMDKQGISWCDSEKKLDKELAQADLVQLVLAPLQDILGNRPVVPVILFRYPPPETPEDPADLLHPDAIDNMFLSLLKTSLEVSIFELVPILAKTPEKFSVSVFVATRKRYNDRLDNNAWMKLYKRFGIQVSAWGQSIVTEGRLQDVTPFGFEDVSLVNDKGAYDDGLVQRAVDKETGNPVKNHYQSIRSDFIYTILAEVLSARQSEIELEVKNAVGVTFSYNTRRPPQYRNFRHMHYVADQVARSAWRDPNNGNITNEAFSSWEPVEKTGLCLIAYRDDAFLSIIDASRRLEAGDLVGALLQALLSKSDDEALINRIVKGRFNPSLKKMSGADFHRFSRMLVGLVDSSQPLKKLPPFQAHSTPKESITIIQKIEKPYGTAFICNTSDGRVVNISINQVKKCRLSNVNVGTTLRAEIFTDNDALYAKSIERV